MDSEVTKVAVEATGKVAESLVLAALKKILHWKPFAGMRDLKHRAGWDRRYGMKERRQSALDRRLRKGFWLEFHRQTETGKFEILDLTPKTRDNLFDALVKEASHYEFSDRAANTVLDPSLIIDSAASIVWSQLIGRPKEERQAILIIEMIAQQLFAKYNIRRRDRRDTQRRLAAAG